MDHGMTVRRAATVFAATAAVVLAAIFALLAVNGSPAAAEEPADLRVELRQGTVALKAGGSAATLVFAVVNGGPSAVSAPVATVQAPFGDRGLTLAATNLTCSAPNNPAVLSCALPGLLAGQAVEISVSVTPPGAGTVNAGENLTEAGSVSVSNPAGGDPNGGNDSAQFSTTLAGPPGGVTQVAGQVADSASGDGVPDATVVVRDGAGKVCRSATDETGAFVCNTAADAPLAAGRITVEVSRDGYQTGRTTVDSGGGALTGIQLALTSTAPPSPSESIAPSSPAAVETPRDQVLGDDEGSGSGLTVLALVLGILLVLGALGGLAWWLYQRRDDETPSPADRPGYAEAPTVRMGLGGLASRPGSPADATRVLGTTPGYAGAADRTAPTVAAPRGEGAAAVGSPYGARLDPYGAPADPYGAYHRPPAYGDDATAAYPRTDGPYYPPEDWGYRDDGADPSGGGRHEAPDNDEAKDTAPSYDPRDDAPAGGPGRSGGRHSAE